MSVCSICGNDFVAKRSSQMVCYSRDCRLERKRIYNRKRWQERDTTRQYDEYGLELTKSIKVCLKCEKEFESYGNRICPKCHTINRILFSGGCIDDVY